MLEVPLSLAVNILYAPRRREPICLAVNILNGNISIYCFAVWGIVADRSIGIIFN
jgi:hypothetical protein